VIADDIWAKLLWAGLRLEPADLVPTARARYCYPAEQVRALAVTWLFTGLRSDVRITSNKNLTEWGGSYTTPPSRPPSSTVLLHHGEVYYLKGDSFRLRGQAEDRGAGAARARGNGRSGGRGDRKIATASRSWRYEAPRLSAAARARGKCPCRRQATLPGIPSVI
jgi:hypothetical protein